MLTDDLLQHSHKLGLSVLSFPLDSPLFPLYSLLVCAVRNGVFVDNVYI